MYQPPEQSQERRPYNDDPYEQPQASYEAYKSPTPEQPTQGQEQAYQKGYGGASYYQQSQGTYTPPTSFPRQRLSSKQIFLLIIGIIIAVNILGGLIASTGGIFALLIIAVIAITVLKFGFDQATPVAPQQFAVSEQSTINITNPFGRIRVLRGEGDKVVVQGVKHISSVLGKQEDMVIDCRQNDNTISVNSRNIATGGIRSGHMDITVFVPEKCNLIINSAAGTIDIQGIHGQANVMTNAGSISAGQSTFTAGTNLHTNAGTLHMEQVKLEGSASLDTNAGTIHFEGELDGAHDYMMSTNAGTIHVELPTTSNIALQAKTDLGTVSNDFAQPPTSDGQQARLNLRTNLGTIAVRRV
ncbi:DUF4097 family beta strand repeat-containing protein [Ktedonospora formicarum]|uniref:Adhesin domain-containing protein n=1 Tax=Ktedonospora formicarum TaxID=2778364 RepID=A0A8J3MVK1_9CHLR|nr:DUF4097 family beta strand repeat-containing protein [Ktedonospora formicarum]GHO46595.1 hypothetical protein KSX_47580 [Ktedonospora formicarum]